MGRVAEVAERESLASVIGEYQKSKLRQASK